jgi:uncharacterized membrane protein
MNVVAASALLLVLYAAGEAMWLFLMNGFYARNLSALTKNLAVQSKTALVLVYPLLLLGFARLVLFPAYKDAHAQRNGGYVATLMSGMLFGLTVYGVYNLTNLATLPGYTAAMVTVDTLWGAFWFGFLALVFYMLVDATPTISGAARAPVRGSPTPRIRP